MTASISMPLALLTVALLVGAKTCCWFRPTGPGPSRKLKIMPEVITLSVFLPFAVFYLKQPLRLDYLWAALCLLGAAYFIFRGG